MSHVKSQPAGASGQAVEFTTTHWSVVLEAGGADSPATTEALEHLCRSYWYPLYVFVRRKGYSPPDAQDLTQQFFARFLERKYLSLADQSRGKFRTFLIRSMEHFLINEWSKAHSAKRGGARPVISWDEQEAEKRYLAEPAHDLPPDKVFEKRWAQSLLETALARLQEEFSSPDKKAIFEALKSCVWGEEAAAPYHQIAAQLGMAEGAVKGTVHRLRNRYRELLRAEVAQTVATSAEVDEELRDLVAVLRQ